MAVTGDEKKPGDSPANILTSGTPILGLKLYIVIAATMAITVAIFVVIFLFLRSKWSSKRRRIPVKHNSSVLLPSVSNEIVENAKTEPKPMLKEFIVAKHTELHSEGKRGSSESNDSNTSRSETSSAISASASMAEGMNIGWGRWCNLKELELATKRFSEENVIGEGGYGIVYRGVLQDGSVVAVKNLLNNKGQAEKEFQVEVEAIGKVRHKNLVGLLGHCAEGARRLLVYEYVDNGNLEQWLHGDVGPVSPLTWDIRMKISIGTAKGLAYLHEGLEPKVVHRDVKSSNILLDGKWNAKVSDFGLAKLLGSEKSHLTTRVMGTFGYVSPDYASTGMLNEGSDVYSFGVLLMEIVTGRSPVDYSRPPGEVNLVDWFKGLVASRRGEELLDPLIKVPPSSRALKRVLLVCLRCIDMDASKRPKMGQIAHMLEAEALPFRRPQEPRLSQETASASLHFQAAESDRIPLASMDVVGGGDPSFR